MNQRSHYIKTISVFLRSRLTASIHPLTVPEACCKTSPFHPGTGSNGSEQRFWLPRLPSSTGALPVNTQTSGQAPRALLIFGKREGKVLPDPTASCGCSRAALSSPTAGCGLRFLLPPSTQGPRGTQGHLPPQDASGWQRDLHPPAPPGRFRDKTLQNSFGQAKPLLPPGCTCRLASSRTPHA